MRKLTEAKPGTFKDVIVVLTDMDETLTLRGRLHAQTYAALERLQQAGVIVIPVTAAPAGWCDQMARMWPVDGVIGENGAFFFRRAAEERGVSREFWLSEGESAHVPGQLAELKRQVLNDVPDAMLADDCAFRLASVSFNRPIDDQKRRSLITSIWRHGGIAAVNSLWVVASVGGFDKLKMSSRILHRDFSIDPEDQKHMIAYVGDSGKSAPMFEYYQHTIGVSTIVNHLDELPVPPNWITLTAGGAGFVEIVEAILKDRKA